MPEGRGSDTGARPRENDVIESVEQFSAEGEMKAFGDAGVFLSQHVPVPGAGAVHIGEVAADVSEGELGCFGEGGWIEVKAVGAEIGTAGECRRDARCVRTFAAAASAGVGVVRRGDRDGTAGIEGVESADSPSAQGARCDTAIEHRLSGTEGQIVASTPAECVLLILIGERLIAN